MSSQKHSQGQRAATQLARQAKNSQKKPGTAGKEQGQPGKIARTSQGAASKRAEQSHEQPRAGRASQEGGQARNSQEEARKSQGSSQAKTRGIRARAYAARFRVLVFTVLAH